MCCKVPNITLSLSCQIKKDNMKSKFGLLRFLLFPVILIAATNLTNAQSKQDSLANQDLYKEIAYRDSILFNAFNTRNIDQFKTLFTEDLEFYHDKGGLTNYEHTIEFMRTTAKADNQLRRDLVKGTLEVYPIPGYGAMEIGTHTFCHIENGKQDCGTFKFVHIWQKKNGQWKISRVISYGH
jgi:Domain of unknown function (DUF4440)